MGSSEAGETREAKEEAHANREPPNDQSHIRRRYKHVLEGFRVKERELKLKTGKRVAS